MSAGLTLSDKSIYIHNGKEYRVLKTSPGIDFDFIIVKAINSDEELKVSAGEFKDSFKLEKFVRGRMFFL